MGFDVMKLIYSDRSALQSLLVNYFARIFLVEKLETRFVLIQKSRSEFIKFWKPSVLFVSLVTGPKLTGFGRGRPDPAFPPLFRENPASSTFFISFPNTAFLSQKNTLKSLISRKANKCKM